MGVGVNETWRHDAAAGVDGACGLVLREMSDRADAAVAHRDIRLASRGTGPVDHGAAHNQQVVLVARFMSQ
jgi:hypothetical protein